MMSIATPSSIIRAIEQVVGDTARPVQLHEPLFMGRENEYVKNCIDEGWVSSVGAFVDRFEKDLADFCGAKYAVAMVNGTCALHLALVALGVQPGEEVLVPSLTFVATANSVSHAGAVAHFVDVEEDSLGICPVKLRAHLGKIAKRQGSHTINKETGRRLTALVPVHVFGHPCQSTALKLIAQEYNLLYVEDATEALGSRQGEKHVGNYSTAVYSFNGNKVITTGGGGAVVTNDESIARHIKHLSTTAKQPHPYAFSHDEIAWNYRMPNINAAMGCAQLEQLPHFLAVKRALAQRYIKAFETMLGACVLTAPEGTQGNYWLTTLLLEEDKAPILEETLQQLHKAKLLCRPVWTPLHQLEIYSQHPRATLATTESLAGRIISLPSSVKLGLSYA